MPWDCGHLARLHVDEDRMAVAFTKQATAMRFQMAHQIDALHAA